MSDEGLRRARTDDLFPIHDPTRHSEDPWRPTRTNRPGVYYIGWPRFCRESPPRTGRPYSVGEAFPCGGRNWRVVRPPCEYDGYFVVPHEWPCWEEHRLFWCDLWERLRDTGRLLQRVGEVWKGWRA